MISWRCKLHVGTSQVQMRTKYGNTVGFVLTKCRTYQYLSNLIVNMLNFIIIWTIWRWCYITHDEKGWGWIWSLFITTTKKKKKKDQWEWKTSSKVATHLFQGNRSSKYKVYKPYLGHIKKAVWQAKRSIINKKSKGAIILIGMRIYPMAYFCVQLRAVDSYLVLSVLHMWAISGTSGSSGFGSVSKEHIESKTCIYNSNISV